MSKSDVAPFRHLLVGLGVEEHLEFGNGAASLIAEGVLAKAGLGIEDVFFAFFVGVKIKHQAIDFLVRSVG